MSKVHFRPEDLSLRLDNTIIRYRGEPYRCRVMGNTLSLSNLWSNREVHSIDAYDDDIDISPIPTGYVQAGRTVIYVSRFARRTARHSLQADSLMTRSFPGIHPNLQQHVTKTKGMADMIMGKYPSFQDARNTINGTRESIAIAINRHTVLSKLEGREVIEVHYREEFVGWMKPNSNRINVPTSDKAEIVSLFLSGMGIDWDIN